MVVLGGPVPGKIGLQSQSVAGPAPHHHTPLSAPPSTLLVLQKTEREPTFTVRATAEQHVECWRVTLSVLLVSPSLPQLGNINKLSREHQLSPELQQGSAKHHLVIRCGEIFSVT